MSAYIVSDETIDCIVSYAVDHKMSMYVRKKGDRTRDPDEIGSILLGTNYDSVNYRYGEFDEPRPYKFTKRECDEGTAVGCIACLEYQSCEHPGWRTSDAFLFLHQMLGDIAEKLCGCCGMEAKWGA